MFTIATIASPVAPKSATNDAILLGDDSGGGRNPRSASCKPVVAKAVVAPTRTPSETTPAIHAGSAWRRYSTSARATGYATGDTTLQATMAAPLRFSRSWFHCLRRPASTWCLSSATRRSRPVVAASRRCHPTFWHTMSSYSWMAGRLKEEQKGQW